MCFGRRIQNAQSRGIAHGRERASLPRLFPKRLQVLGVTRFEARNFAALGGKRLGRSQSAIAME
jgi:hypothetical protein